MCSCTRGKKKKKKTSSKNIPSQRESWNKTENINVYTALLLQNFIMTTEAKTPGDISTFQLEQAVVWKSLQHKMKHPLNNYVKMLFLDDFQDILSSVCSEMFNLGTP